MIDESFLRLELERLNLVLQQNKETFHKTVGAILMCESLLNKIKEDSKDQPPEDGG